MSTTAVLSPVSGAAHRRAPGELLDLEALLGLLAPAARPWLQQTAASLARGVWGWLRRVPERAAGWGAGPDGEWRAW